MNHPLLGLLVVTAVGLSGHGQVLPTVEPLGTVVPARLLSESDTAPCRASYSATRVGDVVIVTAQGAHRGKGVTAMFTTVSATPELLTLRLMHSLPARAEGTPDPFAVSARISVPARDGSPRPPFRVRIVDAAGNSEVDVRVVTPH